MARSIKSFLHWPNAERFNDTLPVTATTHVIYSQITSIHSNGPTYENTDYSNIFVNNVNRERWSVKQRNEDGG